MIKRKHFNVRDIGGNILPIITEGLYSNPLDALREYIQNGIDAECNEISLHITQDVVSIKDDGYGMDRNTAETAIKLGISEKNPKDYVGFRGIGIYSSFNICDQAEIYTKTLNQKTGSKIVFNFEAMRKLLAKEEESRNSGKEPELNLTSLLNQTVYVEDEDQNIIKKKGTLVLLKGLRDAVSKKLNNFYNVSEYLQNTVPVEFNPDFPFAEIIQRKFRDSDLRLVKIKLSMNGNEDYIYRPYRKALFDRGGKFEPKFFNITDFDSGEKYGFVWVCHNDINRVLSNRSLRGLLIKKYGFTIANRNFLSFIFPRGVIYNRIFGEVIIQNEDLIPNAARSDFESNETRDNFIHSFQKTAKKIDRWGNEIQSKVKAQEVLETVSARIKSLSEELPAMKRDINKLLLLNTELDVLEKSLRLHNKYAKEIDEKLFTLTKSTLSGCQLLIKNILNERDKTIKAQREFLKKTKDKKALSEKEPELLDSKPETIYEVFEVYGLILNSSYEMIIRYIDEDVVSLYLTTEEYKDEIDKLRDFLEESL